MLVDPFQRQFRYLRLSVTEACNFRCSYCLPNGYRPEDAPVFLSVDEVGRLATAFAALGVQKIRLTGGEPSLRRDLPQLIARCAGVDGVGTVALTTNGYRLLDEVARWADCGLTALNVSIDSLDDAQFERITGRPLLTLVLRGLERARALVKTVKVNVVYLKGLNDGEVDRFLAFADREQLEVRFIELMQTQGRPDYFVAHHASLAPVQALLEARGYVAQRPGATSGPARRYSHPGVAGSIGLIRPYADNFCSGCNRLRVTARGALKLCLFGSGEADLRPLLHSDSQQDALRAHVVSALANKVSGHGLAAGELGGNAGFSAMGG